MKQPLFHIHLPSKSNILHGSFIMPIFSSATEKHYSNFTKRSFKQHTFLPFWIQLSQNEQLHKALYSPFPFPAMTFLERQSLPLHICYTIQEYSQPPEMAGKQSEH